VTARSRPRSAIAVILLCSITGCAHPRPGTVAKPNHKHERALAAELTRIFDVPDMRHGLWGVAVRSVDRHVTLYARNAHTLMMPASNMKILTLAAAAETLGWDYRFRTTLETSADIEDGTLKGDLIVVGGGDPTINSRQDRAAAVFDEWTAALKAAGISRIDGNVVGDARAFDSRTLGQGWAWDYLQYGYAAPIGALQFNEDTATLSVRPGSKAGDDAALELPPSTGLGLVHRVTTGEPGTPTTIEIERPPGGAWLEVHGTIAADAQPMSRQVAVGNPTLYFTHALVNGLTARGIQVRGLPKELPDWRNTVPPLPRRVVVESFSPPLRDIATTMMKVSENLYAETLLKAVGAKRSGTSGSTEAGIAAAREMLISWKIEPDTFIQVDGSGLSRYDYVTADTVVTVLEHMFRDPAHHDAFVATLPIAGRDGTVSTRMKDTPAEGNATAKTGSIANVRTLSGYVRTRDGETLVFSILANSFAIPAGTVNALADRAVAALANYSAR
jgi:D-alanyl-D-alanine carboxypeptidase/D-alanyl-D-alanine-endopeptidase (penicillin-binding protein 4)